MRFKRPDLVAAYEAAQQARLQYETAKQAVVTSAGHLRAWQSGWQEATVDVDPLGIDGPWRRHRRATP